jgi:FkbM family methyltransferase
MKNLIKTAFNAIRLKKKKAIGNPFELQVKIIGDVKRPITIFDGGAFKGYVSLKYNKLFPNSTIHSFEPYPESFSTLKRNTLQHRNIKPYNKGLGEYVGISKFHSNNFAPTNSLLATHVEGDSNWGGEKILDTKEILDIELTTIDQIVEEENIKRIDILKLDVQGAEYQVMAGAKKTIEKGLIGLIYTEIITIPTYENQQELDEALKMFREYGFELFNTYNSGHTEDGRLQYIDAVFVKKNRSLRAPS